MVEMTDYAPGTPSWVDVSTTDIEAAKAFYGSLFGWESVSYPEMGGYTNFTLDGKLVCGGVPIQSPGQPPAWSTYVCVADADATARAVGENGGQGADEPVGGGGPGGMARCNYPTGAVFWVLQPGTPQGGQGGHP